VQAFRGFLASRARVQHMKKVRLQKSKCAFACCVIPCGPRSAAYALPVLPPPLLPSSHPPGSPRGNDQRSHPPGPPPPLPVKLQYKAWPVPPPGTPASTSDVAIGNATPMAVPCQSVVQAPCVRAACPRLPWSQATSGERSAPRCEKLPAQLDLTLRSGRIEHGRAASEELDVGVDHLRHELLEGRLRGVPF
jgi:hypothetical protein